MIYVKRKQWMIYDVFWLRDEGKVLVHAWDESFWMERPGVDKWP